MIRSAILLSITLTLIAYWESSASPITEKEQWLKDNTALVEYKAIDPPTTLGSGGPDAGGYYYIDSDDIAINAPVFNWIDITTIGTSLNFNGDDQTVGPLPIGFSFNYYGSDFNDYYACTNGWAGLGTQTGHEYLNIAIPAVTTPNNFLAILWDDMDCRTSGEGYYYSNNIDTCIISWIDIPHYSSTGQGLYTFQIILTGNGEIFYQYLSTTGTLNTYTCGIENHSGTIGTQYVYNIERDLTGIALYYGMTPPIYYNNDISVFDILSPIGPGRVGTSISPAVRFVNISIAEESFLGRLIIKHSGELYNQALSITDLQPGATIDVIFPGFIPAETGQYEFIAISELGEDENPTNDTLRSFIEVYSTIFSEDFEAGDGDFAGDNDWQYGTPENGDGPGAAHSGSFLWSTGLDEYYTVGPLLSSLVSPAMSLENNAILSFWQWYIAESGFDGGNIKLSSDGGHSWIIITPTNGYTGTLSHNYSNPIGGEVAFSGSSNGWELETFDLSAFAGLSVLIKFDFGSDSSVNSVGWFIDDFTVIGGGRIERGYINGTVSDAASALPIEGAIVSTLSAMDTTDIDGYFTLRPIPSLYNLTAAAAYHNEITIDGIEVPEGDTTIQNIVLTAPAIIVNTAPIDTAIASGASVNYLRSITNTGNGPLDFTININTQIENLRSEVNFEIAPTAAYDNKTSDISPTFNPGSHRLILNFGDELFTFDPQTPSGDETCLGIEFDGFNFWVTGRHPSDEVHKLHKYDRNGIYLESFNQGTTSVWGWRDLAFDGTYLYGSDENAISKIDVSTGLAIGTIPMPTPFSPPMRGLAYDPVTDHFWSANFTSNIIEFNRFGEIVNSFLNTLSIYGLAWDNTTAGGPWLWAFSQDGVSGTLVSQINPLTGEPTGIAFNAIDHNGGGHDSAGGLCFTTDWNPDFGVLFCLIQGDNGGTSYDLVQGYEITPYSNWLFVDPRIGTINAGQTIDLNITVDLAGEDIVSDSTYRAIITVNSNAPGLQQIPVTILVLSGCSYLPGDANGNGYSNGIDAGYMVNYLKQIGPSPPDNCDCPLHGFIYTAADANGNCIFNGIDVSYLINFLKGIGPGPTGCIDCPPIGSSIIQSNKNVAE